MWSLSVAASVSGLCLPAAKMPVLREGGARISALIWILAVVLMGVAVAVGIATRRLKAVTRLAQMAR